MRLTLKFVMQNEEDLVVVIPFFFGLDYTSPFYRQLFIRHTLTTAAVVYPTTAVSYFDFTTSTETVHVT